MKKFIFEKFDCHLQYRIYINNANIPRYYMINKFDENFIDPTFLHLDDQDTYQDEYDDDLARKTT
jgi:hypothetical protein